MWLRPEGSNPGRHAGQAIRLTLITLSDSISEKEVKERRQEDPAEVILLAQWDGATKLLKGDAVMSGQRSSESSVQ